MRLKKLILQGFKSFADRTEFVFDSPITGIVGPNGCGKSNVVDAFKWVLGEQSAKSLRGDAMLDVIFNGAAGRKPAGMAEVVLVFDNPRRADGTRMLNLDADEVTVGRRLFRDGTSEYQLNNQSSRLKDIRELFLDTGVGVDAYSVIEQGKVALLLDASSQERRVIFEEAAGISKFKARKKEAQRKLERVDQNLLRLNDIVEEVDKRLRSVRVQAGRARTYQEHSQRLRELRLTYALQEYHTLHEQQAAVGDEQQQAEGRLAQLVGQLADLRARHGESQRELDERSARRQRVEYELVQARAAVESARQRQQYASQQLEQIGQHLARLEQDRAEVQEREARTRQALEAETANLAALTAEVNEHGRQIEQQQAAFNDGQMQLNAVNRQVGQDKSTALELTRQLSAAASRLNAIEIERRNIVAQQSRLAERRQAVTGELESLEAARADLDGELAKVMDEIGQVQSQLEETRQEAENLGRQIATITEQLGAAREHRSGLLSRQKLLADLEARREGVSEGVKSVLRDREQKYPFIRGLVADLLRVDVEHASVVEAALDGRDQMLVTEDGSAAAAVREDLAELEGRVNILCTASLPPFEDGYDWKQHPQRVRLALDLVKFEGSALPVAQHLLGRTVVTEGLPDAMDLWHSGPRGYRYVTRDGEVIEADGTMKFGALAATMGLISRRSELEALGSQIAEVDGRIAELSAQLSDGNAHVKSLEEKQNALRNALYQANTRRVEFGGRISQNSDRQSALRRELPMLDQELKTLLETIGNLSTECNELSQRRSGMEAEEAACHRRIEQATARQAELEQGLRSAGEVLTNLRIQLGQAQEKQLAAQQGVRRLEAALPELRQQIERIEQASSQAIEQRTAVAGELDAARAAEQEHAQRQEQLSAELETLAGAVAEAHRVVQESSDAVERGQVEHAAVEQSLHRLQVQAGELRVRLEGLVQRTLEELELDLPARYAELTGQEGGWQPAQTDWDAVAEEIRQLKDKIQRLGNVNLDAIGEQDELEQRQTFLHTQYADLVESKKQLEDLIQEINKESCARFEQTFNAVREHFQGMFRKLFGGGKADIYLETELMERAPVAVADGAAVAPDATTSSAEGAATPQPQIDLLDAGIEIIARPPGKQPVSISQLSGGEKTMTCVALLLSIFKSKPSPFCILDEVDAALDEANNQRFNLIVQEFSAQSQFIIITHSKRTMQITDTLYGVTMQEQGVSKRVAVKFDQVDTQGRILTHAAA